jgi:MFS family permease
LRTLQALRLGILFATIYVVEGIIEPTTGVVAEPVESLLKHWGETPVEIASFLALIGLPWCLKPLFGFLSDSRPLHGYRRRSYLLISSAMGALVFLLLAITHLTHARQLWITALLFVATMTVAATDVVLDARMLDVTKPLGITARIQSVQYGAAYIGAMFAGVLGGRISESRHTDAAFMICAMLMALQWWIIFRWMREAPLPSTAVSMRPDVRATFRATIRSRASVTVAILLAIFHLNPFSQASIYLYLTGPLRLHNSVYGDSLAWGSAGGLVGTIAYGLLGTRLPLLVRANIGVLGGVVSSLAYLKLGGERDLYAISLVSGFTYMLGGLALIDLAARACPTDASGTVYAVFMAVCNLCAALATWLGGYLYSGFMEAWGSTHGFHAFAVCGAIVTGACWGVFPKVPWRELAGGSQGA